MTPSIQHAAADRLDGRTLQVFWGFFSVAAISACGALGSSSSLPGSNGDTPQPSSRTFHFTHEPQRFKVPSGVTQLTITSYGAMGGGFSNPSDGNPGGLGAKVKATIPVTPRQVLIINVGGRGIQNKHGAAEATTAGELQPATLSAAAAVQTYGPRETSWQMASSLPAAVVGVAQERRRAREALAAQEREDRQEVLAATTLAQPSMEAKERFSMAARELVILAGPLAAAVAAAITMAAVEAPRSSRSRRPTSIRPRGAHQPETVRS